MYNRTLIQLCRHGSPSELKNIIGSPDFDINQTIEIWAEGCGTIQCLLTASMNNPDVQQILLDDERIDIDKIVQQYEKFIDDNDRVWMIVPNRLRADVEWMKSLKQKIDK